VRALPGGYSAAGRFVVRWREGGSAFVKAATDADTAAWLRAEYAIYARVRAPFMPALLGWEDDGGHPWLAIEDLSAADWPPPWSPERVEAVRATLRAVAATPPGDLDSFEAHRAEFAGWPIVERDAEPFLRLGLVTERWLAGALPALLDAEAGAVLEGDGLLHNDVRSDNLCFAGGRVVLIDWNWATRGNPKFDLAAWLPSLELEGGPAPESILPDEPELAAFVAGFYAAHAGLPPPRPGMHELRGLQRRMLRASLAWTVRTLGLPELDGPGR
jgi:aminoglycoside phosphotransferase (APT) family kinase protein